MEHDFTNIDYLKSGNSKQQKAFKSLTKHAVFEKLKGFSPILTGTIPLEIAIENSDLDICCSYADKADFKNVIMINFQDYTDFKIRETTLNQEETVIANLLIDDFEIEIFGQRTPVKEQNAYRHMMIEYQILQEKGETFKQQIIELKQSGIKTEPAFALLLNLQGNPYEALLNFKF